MHAEERVSLQMSSINSAGRFPLADNSLVRATGSILGSANPPGRNAIRPLSALQLALSCFSGFCPSLGDERAAGGAKIWKLDSCCHHL